MEKIVVKGIKNQDLSKLTKVFEELKKGKQKGKIDAAKIKDIIGELYNNKFCHLAVEHIIEPKKEAYGDLWDFESWIDAIRDADINLLEIKSINGHHELTLRQNSWPSGGIEAMEELIKIFDAEIVENTMI